MNRGTRRGGISSLLALLYRSLRHWERSF